MSSNNTTAPQHKRTDSRPQKFQPGVNPFTGQPALRTRIYDVLRQFANTEMTPKEIALLIGEDAAKVGQTLAGLIDHPEGYPGVHRPSMGKYLYDISRPSSAVRFTGMTKKAKERNKREAAKQAAIPQRQVSHITIPNQIPTSPSAAANIGTVVLDRFVEVLPVIDTEARTIKATEVLLRDLDGSLWLASKVN